MSGSITEAYKTIQQEFEAKKQILNYLRRNKENKEEVETYIKNEQLNLKIEPTNSGNIWELVRACERNIEKMNKEISIYEKISMENRGSRFKL